MRSGSSASRRKSTPVVHCPAAHPVVSNQSVHSNFIAVSYQHTNPQPALLHTVGFIYALAKPDVRIAYHAEERDVLAQNLRRFQSVQLWHAGTSQGNEFNTQ